MAVLIAFALDTDTAGMEFLSSVLRDRSCPGPTRTATPAFAARELGELAEEVEATLRDIRALLEPASPSPVEDGRRSRPRHAIELC